MATYDQRRAVAMNRLHQLAMARQRWDNHVIQMAEEEERRRQAEELALEQQAAEKERADKLNWFDDASKGAAMGSAAGPWGALVGGIAGTIKGQYEATKERGGGIGNYLKVAMDTPFGFNPGSAIQGDGFKDSTQSLGGNTLGNLGMAYGNSMAVKKRQDALRSRAQSGAVDYSAAGRRNPYNTGTSIRAGAGPLESTYRAAEPTTLDFTQDDPFDYTKYRGR